MNSAEQIFALLQQRQGNKTKALVARPQGGLEEILLDPKKAATPCLNRAQIRTLATIAAQLEHHFNGPQDIEWAVTDSGQIFVLQSRPLRISAPAFQSEDPGKTGNSNQASIKSRGPSCRRGGGGAGIFAAARRRDS